MTDANGPRNPSNNLSGTNLSGTNLSGSGGSSNTSNTSNNGSSSGTSAYRSRRDLARKPLDTAAAKDSRRRSADGSIRTAQKPVNQPVNQPVEKSALERLRASRAKRKTGDSPEDRLRHRARRVTSGSLSSGSGVKPTDSNRRSGQSAGKTTPPNLGLARRRTVRRKTPIPLLYLGRLAIAGLGIAAIGGTLLKVLPGGDRTAAVADSALTVSAENPVADFPIPLNQEIASLKTDLQGLPNSYPDLTPKVFYIDVDTGDYVNLEGNDAIAAASTIKLPILLAFFEEIDEGRITLNQAIALLPEQIAEGSGEMQLSPVGTQFTALEVATQMIISSDNTATNMMIDLLGGAAVLNERFKSYGLQKTQLNSPLPDLAGANMTSARDLVHTMLLISGDRLTLHSRDRIFNILNRTRNKSLLAAGLNERGALTYNKTGDIQSVLGDVVMVDMSNGKRYIVAALVKRPSNDGRAVDLIQSISGRTFKEANDAVQTSIAPLGNPKTTEGAATGAAESTTKPVKPIESTESSPEQAESYPEEPYPSANPASGN